MLDLHHNEQLISTTIPTTQLELGRDDEKECLMQQDCAREGEMMKICANHNCIDTLRTGLRVTLTWTGEDDLDLFAYSPFETSVSYRNPHDSITGGIFAEEETGGTSTQQFSGYRNHVENILFPDKGSGITIGGEYIFEVKPSHNNNNPLQDKWRLEVYTDEHLAMVETGSGASGRISFHYGVVVHEELSSNDDDDSAHDEPAAPELMAVDCDTSIEECCIIDDDCPAPASGFFQQRPKICLHHKCITAPGGHLRFALESSRLLSKRQTTNQR